MSIEAHKCNAPDCKGFVVFENADFDFKNIPTDEKAGIYAFSNPHCSECGKEFLVVPHYVVIDYQAEEIIDSACITAFDRRERERKFEEETGELKVKYIGGIDFYDGWLTTGKTYEVIDQTESQFKVNNDVGGTSTIFKDKFEVQE